MRSTAQIARAYRQAGAMNSLIPFYGFLDDTVFLTKSGDVGIVLALAGVDAQPTRRLWTPDAADVVAG